MNQERLRELFNYDPNVGLLVWKENRGRIKAGTPCISAFPNGRRRIKIEGKHYVTARLIWIWVTGEQPGTIMHIDGDCTNERFDNLRDSNHVDIACKSKFRRNNRSGFANISELNVRGHKYYRFKMRRYGLSHMKYFPYTEQGLRDAVIYRNKIIPLAYENATNYEKLFVGMDELV